MNCRYEHFCWRGHAAATGAVASARQLQTPPLQTTYRYEHFCSAHLSTDAAFGSIGSFFGFFPPSGSFEANPPFDDVTIQRMVQHMEHLLRASDRPLNFAIIIPYLPDQQGWKLVYESPYKRAHLRVKQSEHGYYEGSQHDRITRFRVAPFDTSVIFLQVVASDQWLVPSH